MRNGVEQVAVHGTDQAEQLSSDAVRFVVHAGAGSDVVGRAYNSDPYYQSGYACPTDYRLYGEHGNDRLAGTQCADRLVGGPGNDTVLGGLGTDRCLAEHETSCER